MVPLMVKTALKVLVVAVIAINVLGFFLALNF